MLHTLSNTLLLSCVWLNYCLRCGAKIALGGRGGGTVLGSELGADRERFGFWGYTSAVCEVSWDQIQQWRYM